MIVHKDNPHTELGTKELDRIFLKRDKSWEHGPAIEPVNLPDGSATRERFSDDVHGRSTSSIESYWQRQIFSGRGTPPDTLANDAAVIAYVANKPGGIGYVAPGTTLPSTVKAVKVVAEK